MCSLIPSERVKRAFMIWYLIDLTHLNLDQDKDHNMNGKMNKMLLNINKIH